MNDYIEYVSGSLQGSVGKTVSKKGTQFYSHESYVT